ncbi:hypothetical protein AYI86_00790 [Shewanella algae]|nr:hypothetical protein AYI86_00790 [Shewanella algae]
MLYWGGASWWAAMMLKSLLGEAGLRLSLKAKLENRLLLVFRCAESERWFLTALIFNRFGL